MRNTKWTNLTSTVLAGTTIGGVMVGAYHKAKKYGQRTNPNRVIDLSLYNVVDYAINKFLNTDDEKLAGVVKTAQKLTKSNNSDSQESSEANDNEI